LEAIEDVQGVAGGRGSRATGSERGCSPAEQEARDRGCARIVVTTHSFQAPRF
jgi:hypothetical protein